MLIGTDVSVADHGELAAAAAASARLRAFVDLSDVQIARRGAALAADGDRSSEHVLIDEGRLSGRECGATRERDRVCGQLPQFEEALAAGGCTAGHLDAIARHTKDLTDEERSDVAAVVDDLLGHAAAEPVGLFDKTAKSIIDRVREMHRPDHDVDELDRQRAASKVKRWTERDTGMKLTQITLDPLRDTALWNAIDAHLATLRHDPANQDRTFDELRVDAVIAAVTTSGTGTARVPEVIVHVDAASLCHDRHERTVCETIDGQPVPVATAQRLCCEAILQAVVVNPDGSVDRLCAEQRTANRAQRRMLAAIYATCAHPLCEVGFSQCRIHHVEWFTNGGHTVLANLLPLCETHHHLVHEGRWHLTITADRTVTWHKPDHTIWRAAPRPDRQPTAA